MKSWFWFGLIGLFSAAAGCADRQATDVDELTPATKVAVGPLRVAVVDDESLAAILEREWRATSEYEIQITKHAHDDFQQQLDGGISRLDADVVIYPSQLLGQLVEQRLLRPIPRELLTEPTYQNGDIFDLIRRRESQWNRQPYAAPFGSPVFMLLRRTDMVPNEPMTWTALQNEVARLEETLPDGVSPLAQPLADGWGAKVLLARAAGYLFDDSKVSTVFEFSSMKPRIDSAPFRRAARELAASCVGPTSRSFTPATALEKFIKGEAAMAITWPSAWLEPTADTIDFPVAISPLPGVDTVYKGDTAEPLATQAANNSQVTLFGIEGRLGSVSRSARNASLANIFLAWATGPQQSGKLSTRSPRAGPFRSLHCDKPNVWGNAGLPPTLRTDYLTVTHRALSQAAAIQAPRLPGQHRYMAALDSAVEHIVDGSKTPELALAEAAVAWKTITEELVLDKQKLAYRRSLGIKTD